MRLASFGSALLLIVSAGLAALGCSSSGSAPPLEAGICTSTQSHYYATAGCGASAPEPVCMDDIPAGQTCAGKTQVCGCDGVTRDTNCEGAVKGPWATTGPCAGDSGTTDSGTTDSGTTDSGTTDGATTD